MSIEAEVHPIQISILRVLMYKEEARFSDLNSEKISTDHFNFHVKKLLELELIEKTVNNRYRLTPKGKEFTNRFDTDQRQPLLERQAKIGVLVVCTKKEGNAQKYLAQQRLKQPYYGFYGFVTGKVKWGETINEAAIRELKEETGLAAKVELKGVKHKMDYSPAGDLLEDKYFYVFKATEPAGELLEKFEAGRNIWLTRNEILKLPDLFHGVEESLEIIKGKQLAFIERKYTVEKY